MRSNRPHAPVSLGTILILCLTAIVAVGCVFVFGKIQGQNTEASMNAQKVFGLVGSALQGTTPEPALPQSTVRTVTVTLAPRPQQTPPPDPIYPAVSLPSAAPPQQGQHYVFSVTAGGMLGFHSDISDSVYDAQAKSFRFTEIGAMLKAKTFADLNLVTLPQLINTQDLKYADILAPSAIADAIREMGFNEALLSTEHILDQGAQGAEDTASALTNQRISAFGVNTASSQQHQILSLNGVRVALLLYTDVLTAKGQNELAAHPALLQPFNLETARRDIQAVRAQGASCVIVCMYWGRADTTTPTNAQKNTARSLAEMGADVILGTRPTRVLPVEIIGSIREDGKYHETLVAYSLGSLLTESREGYDISGILLHFNVILDEYGQLSFGAVEYTPTYIWKQAVNGKPMFRILCSADAAPVGMNADQQRYMQNALNRIQKTMQNSPVSQRSQ